MSRRVCCEALRRPPSPQDVHPSDPVRNGLTNFQTAQSPQAIATPTATIDCQSILTPSQSHRALIRHQRRNVSQ